MVLKITEKEEIHPILKFWLPSLHVIEPMSMQENFEKQLRECLLMN
jgi:hypothetical protein